MSTTWTPRLQPNSRIANRDTIVGIKVAHYRGPDWTPVERGVEAGTIAKIPVMVDFGEFRPERPFQDLVLKKLRPGDIYTHAFYAPVPMLDEKGRLLPYLFEARKRGVLFDVGHGGAAFEFRQAVPAVKQGFPPDSISTDIHSGSINAGMKDQLNVMSKFLNMGMSLDDVIYRSTWNPARIIHREEFGHLSVGAIADIAVSAVRKRQVRVCRLLGRAHGRHAATDGRTHGGVRPRGLRLEWNHARQLGQARQVSSRRASAPGTAREADPALGPHVRINACRCALRIMSSTCGDTRDTALVS